MDPVSITCPNCSASLKISKPELIGATINCPKCKTPFVAAREEAFDLEPPDLAYGFVNDEPELPPAPLLRPAAPRQPAQPDTRKQPSQRKSKGPEEPAKGKKRTGKKRKKTKPSVPLGERLQKWWPAIVLILLIATAGVYFGNGFLLSLAVKRAVRDGRLDGAVTIRSWADLKRNSNVLRPVAEPTASGSPAQPAQGGSPPPAQSNETPQPQAPNEPNPEPTPAAPIVSGVAPGSNAPAPPGDAAALPPATPAEMPKLPNRRFDLSYLPPKPELVASVRVGELWNTPAVKGLLGSLGPGAQQVVDDWSGRLGVSLEDVESVVVGATGLADTISKGMPFAAAPPADPADDAKAESKTTTEDNFVVVVRTVNPYDPEKVLEAFPHKDPIQHAGSSYYVSDGAGDMATPPCVHFADPKTIVVASEPAIQAAISRGRRRPGVPQMLQSFNASYHLVVAVVAYDTDLFGTVAGLAPETGAKGLSSAIAQHASAIGLSLHAGDGLTAEMTVRCKNPNGAADVARAADEAVAQMREQASAVDPAAPGAMGSVPLEVMNTVSMRQAGPSVTMTAAVPPSVFEPQNLQIAMAPLNPLAAMLAGGFFATGGTPTGSALEAADPEAIGPDGPFAAVDDDEPIVPRQPRTGPPRIVVDATKGGFSWWYPQRGPQFDPAADHKGKALVDYFQQRGWAVRELAEGDDVVAALGESDVAIRFGDTAPHTPQEVRAYDRFVQSGGALLLLAGHRPEEREDPLAAAFGVRFGGQIAGGSIQEWDRRHPVTRRLDPVFFTFASEVTEWPESATILGWTGERSDQGVILGTLEHGGGTVVFLSCDSLLARVPQPLTDRVFALLSGDRPRRQANRRRL
jgi:hypothetical protein